MVGAREGTVDGDADGVLDGVEVVGFAEGVAVVGEQVGNEVVGLVDGDVLGDLEGAPEVGFEVGMAEGRMVDGEALGSLVGRDVVGLMEGMRVVGFVVGLNEVGALEGDAETGFKVGAEVGENVEGALVVANLDDGRKDDGVKVGDAVFVGFLEGRKVEVGIKELGFVLGERVTGFNVGRLVGTEFGSIEGF